MEEINKLMDEEIVSQIKGLKTLQAGSQEQTAAIKNLTALYEARINQEKVQLDADDKREKREMEREQHRADETLRKSQAADEAAARERDLKLKEAQAEDQKIDRLVRAGIEMLGIGLPLVCYGHWFRKGLKFEETGSITSSMMRNLINKFKTKK